MCFAVGPERFVPRCGCSVTCLRDARMDLVVSMDSSTATRSLRAHCCSCGRSGHQHRTRHGHIGMTIAPAGIAAVRKSFLDLMAPATG